LSQLRHSPRNFEGDHWISAHTSKPSKNQPSHPALEAHAKARLLQ
jgi:hypothetical protein